MGPPGLQLGRGQLQQLAEIVGATELYPPLLQAHQQVCLVLSTAGQPQPVGAAGPIYIDLPGGGRWRGTWFWPWALAKGPQQLPSQGIQPVALSHDAGRGRTGGWGQYRVGHPPWLGALLPSE